MRHSPAIFVACIIAAVIAVLQVHGGTPRSFASWALFSFAVSAFRGPLR